MFLSYLLLSSMFGYTWHAFFHIGCLHNLLCGTENIPVLFGYDLSLKLYTYFHIMGVITVRRV